MGSMSEPRPDPAGRSQRVFEWIIVATLLVAGGGILTHQWLLWRRGIEVQNWSVVNGRVERSDGNCSRSGYRSGRSTNCNIRGRYIYEVDGTRYFGERFTFDDLNVRDSHTLDSLVRRFWAGTRVAVHFDPDNPSVSVLDSNSQFRAGRVFAGALAAAAGLFAVARALSRQRKRRLR